MRILIKAYTVHIYYLRVIFPLPAIFAVVNETGTSSRLIQVIYLGKNKAKQREKKQKKKNMKTTKHNALMESKEKIIQHIVCIQNQMQKKKSVYNIYPN